MRTEQSICRITSLVGFDGVLLGRDLHGIFKKGHVYSVVEIMGEFIIKDLGEHAVPAYLEGMGKINQYALSGVHMLTKEEYANQLQREKE